MTVINTEAELAAACPGGLCPPPGRDADIEGGQRRAIAADVIGGVGIAALGTGLALWFLRATRGGPTPTALVITDRGATAGWAF